MYFTDVLVINEIEAGKIVGMDLRSEGGVDLDACVASARELIEHGVQRQVVIHFAEGAVVAGKAGTVVKQGSLHLPPGFITGATGAGDAFAAGYLHGWHEGWQTSDCLRLAVCSAAASLTHPTPSQGLRSVAECLKLAQAHGYTPLG